jgi:hypothetical protein
MSIRFPSVVRVGVVLVAGFTAAGVTAAEPPKLRYGFQAGREYGYDVKVTADLPGEILHYDGTLTYNVLSATDEQFTWKCTGNLPEHVEVKPGQVGPRRIGPPMRMHGPRPHFFGGPFAQPIKPAGTSFDRRGELVMEGAMRPAPALLGWLEMLVLEPLPAQLNSTWDRNVDLRVVEKNQATTPFGHPLPFGETETNRGAVELNHFAIADTKDQVVHVNKTFSLKTAREASGTVHIDMTGNGDFDFGLADGTIHSLSMKYTIVVSESNVNVTVPVTLKYRLLSEAELAEIKRKAAEAAKALAESLKPKPLAAKDRAQVLKDLRSADSRTVKAAAKQLGKSIRDDAAAPAVSAALVKALKGADDWTKADLLTALDTWATPEAESALIEASQSGSFIVRDPALRALGKHCKTKTAAEAVVAQFYAARHVAAEALKSMGPVAEPAALPLLSDRDNFVRGDARGVMAEIGGKKSLRVLEDQLKKNPNDRFWLEGTIHALEKRVADAADTADSAAEESGAKPAAGPKMRTWHDASGSFEVEAVFVGAEGEKVTIKRKDGHPIAVPLAKLSEEDQEYVKEQTKPKPVNPFQ